jgi:MauM/NapG family ferredoxin protein
VKRRTFIQGVVGTGLSSLLVENALSARNQPSLRFLRPPGSLLEDEFISRCIRCGKCGETCPNRCIKYFDLENGMSSMGTPFIIPREQACILCMKCGDICPTGAIQPVVREMEPILEKVKMGKARVDRNLCLSWQGKTCGVCYRACPLADVAIRIGMLEQPHVLKDCVGCGLCERSCIQIPQAIRIIPDHNRETA